MQIVSKLFCKKLKQTIEVPTESTNCPKCGANLVNMGFCLAE